MQQQITRGDYLEDLITIYIENNLQQGLDDLYDMFVFQCGEIQKQITPAPVIKISFTEQESQLLTDYNTCYLAGITKEGHKETFNGSISFNTRGEVVYYEPTPNGSLQASTTSTIACPCTGISGVFANCTQPAIKAYFSINYVPTKLSELTNDTDFQDSVDVANSIAAHNASESAHPYIQSVLASTTEAIEVEIGDLTSLTTSDKSSIVNAINSEVSDRIANVSNAIVTTEAYTDSIVSVNTEATKAYADSIVSTATTATEAYADSILQSATTAINTTIGDLDNLDTSVKSSVVNAINSEVTARENADNNLQGQIDGLAAASDVTDIVGTYQDLQNYDTQHLNDNDIIKVLSDSTHDDQPSYYRFDKDTDTFSYIGSESAAYTKAQSDSIFVTQTTEINGHALSSDINLTYSDVGALADSYATVISANTSAIAANTTAIASNTSVIAQHTTVIASNTSSISTINGKIPTDASSSNKLVSASTLAASIANFANQDLSNLTSTGEARLHALKCYADNGELLQDANGLAFVEKYAHSTFDLSKFTKVGTPTITSDGIASGFSNSNYLRIVNNIGTSYNTFTLKLKIRTGSLGASYNFFGGNSNHIALATYDNKWDLYLGSGSSWDILNDGKSVNTVSSYTDYFMMLVFDGSKYSLKVSTDDINYTDVITVNSLTKMAFPANFAFGYAFGTAFSGQFDLKQFSITVDGVEVFSGNKTGVDTVKADDYTVEGTPTISDDGIASGFSENNYIISPQLSYSTNDVFETRIRVKSPSNFDNYRYPYSIGGASDANGFAVQFSLNGDIGVSANGGYSPTGSYVTYSGYSLNTIYDIYIRINFAGSTNYPNGHIYTEIRNENGALLFSDEKFPSTNDVITASNYSQYVYVGKRNLSDYNFPYTSGYVDLNSIRIYKNGSLVYQPCLKIPFTLSKTGSKVVNAIYRDRVNDMAEQFGYANYYTLDEDNGNFTLPQVELYGLIGSKTLRDSYRNGINYWELYSNRDLEQGGSCTSGVEVTFAKPFADTNYVLSVPYSAKSATAFTPTQTGDWIAKGKGAL